MVHITRPMLFEGLKEEYRKVGFNIPDSSVQNIVNNFSDNQIATWGHEEGYVPPKPFFGNGGNGGISFTKMEPKTIALLIVGGALLYKMWGR